jgi:hypothetical protein
VFVTLDDDANDLVDALECLASIAVMSAMTPAEKARFVFGAFDLDESGTLSPQEFALALRATCSGLCKLSGMDVPLEEEIERVAAAAFLRDSANGGALARLSPKVAPFLSVAEFLTYCEASPELSSWLAFYGDLEELDVPVLRASDLDELCELVSLRWPFLTTGQPCFLGPSLPAFVRFRSVATWFLRKTVSFADEPTLRLGASFISIFIFLSVSLCYAGFPALSLLLFLIGSAR